jgi:UDP-N-acetylglucosamine 2-epimerase (non-hydrolysing)
MQPAQTLGQISARVLTDLEPILTAEAPSMVLVQGDTSTAFAGALAAFLHGIPVGHVEAGLRTYDNQNPFPEEMNRRCIDVFAELCFAPTATSKQALLSERVASDRIVVTGNTGIDALYAISGRPHEFTSSELRAIDFTDGSTTLLVTTHRRESFGAPLEQVCAAVRDLLASYPRLRVILPVHPNPAVAGIVIPMLGGVDRVHLVEPLDYVNFVHLMDAVDLVLTDSGGVQEEAPALGKPVLVIREVTERPEAITAGTARLVGTDQAAIVAAVSLLLEDASEYRRMSKAASPYGDGHAARRTVHAIRNYLGLDGTVADEFDPARVSTSAGASPPMRTVSRSVSTDALR